MAIMCPAFGMVNSLTQWYFVCEHLRRIVQGNCQLDFPVSYMLGHEDSDDKSVYDLRGLCWNREFSLVPFDLKMYSLIRTNGDVMVPTRWQEPRFHHVTMVTSFFSKQVVQIKSYIPDSSKQWSSRQRGSTDLSSICVLFANNLCVTTSWKIMALLRCWLRLVHHLGIRQCWLHLLVNGCALFYSGLL